jgi:hypothetical protein
MTLRLFKDSLVKYNHGNQRHASADWRFNGKRNIHTEANPIFVNVLKKSKTTKKPNLSVGLPARN